MQEEKTTTELSIPDGEKFSRRDFARMATLGAAAATTIAASSATAQDENCDTGFSELTLELITDSEKDCVYVGERCSNFLIRLNETEPDLNVRELVYGSFQDLIDKFVDNERERENGDEDIEDLMDDLSEALGVINGKLDQGEEPISFGDLFMTDEDTEPRNRCTLTEWNDVYRACRAEKGGKALRRVFPLTFLQLRPTGHPSQERENITKFLTPPEGEDETLFETKAGNYKYLDLFIENKRKVCVTPEGNYDEQGYALIRKAFDLGLFSTVVSRYGLGLGKNSKCWSTSENRCKTSTNNDYCATEGGVPTPSSDICP